MEANGNKINSNFVGYKSFVRANATVCVLLALHIEYHADVVLEYLSQQHEK